MKQWLRKTLIVLVSIVTFGTVTPSHALWSEDQDHRNTQQRGQGHDESLGQQIIETEFVETKWVAKDHFVTLMTEEAEKQAMIKFGPKISKVIEQEFCDVILPNIESAIQITATQFPEDALANLAITESPGGGVSEKIFHIYNAETKKDVIRFHVRRDKPPLEGYTFNFHYHTYHDQFQTHYTLGTIYWDKNTPPKWRTV